MADAIGALTVLQEAMQLQAMLLAKALLNSRHGLRQIVFAGRIRSAS
ncbi:hypothetical protein [Cupriavidus necator]